MASKIMLVLTWPSGRRPVNSAHGGAAKGRATARASAAATSWPLRRRAASRNGGGPRYGPTLRMMRSPCADSVRPSARASMSCAPNPARKVAPASEPADVPTMTSAVRGSHPIDFCSAARTPEWNAPPATPPAPKTSATVTP